MVILNIGRRKRGKTTLAYYQALKVPQRFIFDPRAMIQRPGSVRVHSKSVLRERAFPALQEGEITELVYQPHDDDIQGAFAAFSKLAKEWITTTPEKPLAIMVDETSFVNLREPAFEWVLKCCESDRIHILLTCHRPADLPVGVRAIADRWCLFQTRQPHDLEVIEERCSPEVARAVQRIEGHTFVVWDDAHASAEVFTNAGAWHIRLKEDAPGAPAAVVLTELDPKPATPSVGLPFDKQN